MMKRLWILLLLILSKSKLSIKNKKRFDPYRTAGEKSKEEIKPAAVEQFNKVRKPIDFQKYFNQMKGHFPMRLFLLAMTFISIFATGVIYDYCRHSNYEGMMTSGMFVFIGIAAISIISFGIKCEKEGWFPK